MAYGRGWRIPPSGRELEDPFGTSCPRCGVRGRETSDTLGRGVVDCAHCGVVVIPRRPPTEAERLAAELDEAERYRHHAGKWPEWYTPEPS